MKKLIATFLIWVFDLEEFKEPLSKEELRDKLVKELDDLRMRETEIRSKLDNLDNTIG